MNNPRIYARPSREWPRYQRTTHKLARSGASFAATFYKRAGRYSMPPYLLR